MLFRNLKRTFKVPIYVNFGKGRIELREVKVEKGCTVLEATRKAFSIDYFSSDEPSGHKGAVVVAIEGVKSDLTHSWVFYIHDEKLGGWYFPDQTCDKVMLRKGNIVCWRFYNHKVEGFPPRRPPLTMECMRFGQSG
ncbi:MAG: hypothetical protein QXD66_05165 [Candidatus Nezhaarchaeales archaeon]|nr:MAG: hypothetical protein DSO06_05590 [Candidatus Nezhaarchaeota archaeon WYZ-LMO8]TDA35785.1 MAG: hypothetical protein DSO05_04785 [Candidatus Nezhaarchaeota archaeon WYZ-LMO7]